MGGTRLAACLPDAIRWSRGTKARSASPGRSSSQTGGVQWKRISVCNDDVTILGSLTNRIFLASAALAVLSIGAAVYFVSRTTTREAEAELQRGLLEAGTLVDEQCATLVRTLTIMARLVADDPRLKAAVDTGDPPAVQPLGGGYQEQLNAALMVLTGRNGHVLAEAGHVRIAEGAVGALPEIQ